MKKELSSKFEGLIALWRDRIYRIHRSIRPSSREEGMGYSIEDCISDLEREIRIIEADMVLTDLNRETEDEPRADVD